MKKLVFVLLFILAVVCGIFSQPMDLIVVLDTSASMSSSYRETSDYLVGPFLREFLRMGDTFHLVSFSGTPKLEISRRIAESGDVEAVIGRLLLMYPLDPESDVSGALNFAEKYASSLPVNRQRKIVLVTDGDVPATQNLVGEVSARLKNAGTELQYIKVPVTGNGPSSGRPAAAPSGRPAQTAQPAPQDRVPAEQVPGRQPLAQTAPSGTQPVQTARPPQGRVPAEQAPGRQSPAQTQTAEPVISAPPPAAQQRPVQSAPPVSQTTSPQAPAPVIVQPPAAVPPVSQTPPPQTAVPAETQPVPSPVPPAESRPPQTARAPEQGRSPAEQVPGRQPPAQTQTTEPAIPPATTPVQTVPPAAATPAQSIPQTTPATPSSRTTPEPAQNQTSSSDSGSSLFSDGIPLPLIILLAILALAILGLIIFLAARRLQSSPNRVMAQAASDPRDAELMSNFAEKQRGQQRPPLEYAPPERKPMPKDKIYASIPAEGTNGPLMLNLFVDDQNTAIGRRNIHAVKSGYTFSVGGGKSDFLIFLVPVPPHIADVVYDGRNCTFIPRKPKYFPDIGSQSVPNCIGKTIRVISDRNYELYVRIELYEDPLKALNNLLHSISVPGEAPIR